MDIGDLEFESTLSGLTGEFFDAKEGASGGDNVDDGISRQSDVHLMRGRAAVTDRSLVSRITRVMAKRANINPDQYRAHTKAALAFMLAGLGNHPFREKAIAAAQSFLDGNKRLTVSLNPPEPFSFADLARKRQSSLPKLYELLGIDIQAAPAPAQ